MTRAELIAAYLRGDIELLMCECGHIDEPECFDVCGADPGNVFCLPSTSSAKAMDGDAIHWLEVCGCRRCAALKLATERDRCGEGV